MGHPLHVDDFPTALTVVCWLLLVVAIGCAVLVLVDVVRRPQKMTVMAVVWPLTMLFGSLLWLRFYLRRGRGRPRGSSAGSADSADGADGADGSGDDRPFGISVAVGASHCGAGCTLGDLLGEFTLVAVPALAAVVGLGTLYDSHIVAGWIVDFVIAFVAGIVFQYFSIAPMRGLSLGAGIKAALKADVLSISSWQVGMYGLMAVVQFALLPAWLGGYADTLTPEFWVAMQFAMITGFGCAFPVNWWLIRSGLKEAM